MSVFNKSCNKWNVIFITMKTIIVLYSKQLQHIMLEFLSQETKLSIKQIQSVGKEFSTELLYDDILVTDIHVFSSWNTKVHCLIWPNIELCTSQKNSDSQTHSCIQEPKMARQFERYIYIKSVRQQKIEGKNIDQNPK